MSDMQASQLAALLQLSSPALPIGGYSYSQGFEAAVDNGLVNNEDSAGRWIAQQLNWVMAQGEAPAWILLFDAWSERDWTQVAHWNDWFHTTRESQELRQETEQMGWSLVKLADQLNWGEAPARQQLLSQANIVYPAAHAYCVHALDIAKPAGLAAYLFTWLENQVMAAIKTVPLGQMAGQRILNDVRSHIPAVCDEAFSRAAHAPPRLATLAPQLAIVSARHETQYSRLFRS